MLYHLHYSLRLLRKGVNEGCGRKKHWLRQQSRLSGKNHKSLPANDLEPPALVFVNARIHFFMLSLVVSMLGLSHNPCALADSTDVAGLAKTEQTNDSTVGRDCTYLFRAVGHQRSCLHDFCANIAL
ncbi:hypothetical protein Pla22_37260 [Rubripirellula amarantea]|uniref:Uncharacterized protein n=1 Tax=Rubripirellula amarantea TaxID=2527999 RepID=A0A5C5WMG1_9BACT|nr:hypothetical protein Pla22_37260 [Rubripirellula amarantea]